MVPQDKSPALGHESKHSEHSQRLLPDSELRPWRVSSGLGASTPALPAQGPSEWDLRLSQLFTSTTWGLDSSGTSFSPSFATGGVELDSKRIK